MAVSRDLLTERRLEDKTVVVKDSKGAVKKVSVVDMKMDVRLDKNLVGVKV